MVGQQLTHITYIAADYSLYSHHLFTSCQEIEHLSRNEPWWQHNNMLTIHCATSHLKLMTTAQVLAPAHPKEEWAWHNLKITLSNIFHQWNKRCLKESKKGSLKAWITGYPKCWSLLCKNDLHCNYVLSSLRLFKLKSKGQIIKKENLAEKLTRWNQISV